MFVPVFCLRNESIGQFPKIQIFLHAAEKDRTGFERSRHWIVYNWNQFHKGKADFT